LARKQQSKETRRGIKTLGDEKKGGNSKGKNNAKMAILYAKAVNSPPRLRMDLSLLTMSGALGKSERDQEMVSVAGYPPSTSLAMKFRW